ncbi:brain-specific angiogenesis inhibitor 1-associated protein 2-like protein 1b isoform X2 [Neolamprologus brichardi]|uniref:brain-specific angiogenesis inhibitor 1-associated protein 2-like protein 1b isoform X2 n=1 Tax=Neolamprologus brichardi TaxID=32507 RepID=UPI0003EBBD74|nr:brain-specific angiogenesis inhibitor 1-associated protein 2-like protein 1b isoform X2 [Neolamprologus brichardi]
MSRNAEEVNKLAESTYKTVMEQFNPGLRNLVNLGKNYEKSVAGVVLTEISEVHRNVHLELEENFKRFHRDIIAELERKTDMDVKYMTATFKRYQMEHKMKQDSLEKSQADLKKLRRKSQGKNANKYENKESECLETLASRQMDMQLFVADGCKEALLEEKRRFCFLVDKHCMLSYQFASFHDKARDILSEKLSTWQDQCKDATNMPESVLSMIEGLRKPVPITPLPSPSPSRHSVNISTPPAPPKKAEPSRLVNMFNQENNPTAVTPPSSNSTDHGNGEDSNLARSVSVATGLNNMVKRPRVRTIFPHTAGNNNTLLSFEEGDVIVLLIPDERDGWMYGEMEKNGKRGWFPSSYCRALTETLVNNSEPAAPYRSRSVVNLHHQDTETDEATMVLPPADYSDIPQRSTNNNTSSATNSNHHHSPTPSVASSSDHSTASQPNGTARPPPAFLAGGNPFATVRLRPTVTNDRSAPVI